jgi:hypothetical protein
MSKYPSNVQKLFSYVKMKRGSVMGWEEKKAHSLALLERYRGEIDEAAYRRICKNIGTHAIEGIFLDRQDIEELVDIETGAREVNALIARYTGTSRQATFRDE